jgi:hypothetical protein
MLDEEWCHALALIFGKRKKFRQINELKALLTGYPQSFPLPMWANPQG